MRIMILMSVDLTLTFTKVALFMHTRPGGFQRYAQRALHFGGYLRKSSAVEISEPHHATIHTQMKALIQNIQQHVLVSFTTLHFHSLTTTPQNNRNI